MGTGVLGVAVLASVLVTARPTVAAPAAGDTVLTRHVQGTGRSDVYTIGADGTGLRRHPGRRGNPTFAPDGMLAFERDGWIVGLRQGQLVNVRPGTDPAWSPDRTYLAFVGDEGIYLTLGQSARRIADGAFPAWSPDGKRLVYQAADGGLEAVTVLGLTRQRVTARPPASEDLYPSWRPVTDGAR